MKNRKKDLINRGGGCGNGFERTARKRREKERRSWHNDEGINRREGLKREEETGHRGTRVKKNLY